VKVIIVTEPKSGDAADIYQDLEVELHKKPGEFPFSKSYYKFTIIISGF
jgi:hypothetical protein